MKAQVDIVYFELNNWFAGRDYPYEQPFIEWFAKDDIAFENKQFVEDNELCVVCSIVDMSMNYCITAKRSWVEKKCPQLLTKYARFLRYPKDNGTVRGQFGNIFKSYSKENIGRFYQDFDKNSNPVEEVYKDIDDKGNIIEDIKPKSKPKKLSPIKKTSATKKAPTKKLSSKTSTRSTSSTKKKVSKTK